ncbi:uncharacterized protein LOC116919933 [Daphnia magna]|uniref:uncharacterized protein LOC116919933 n=1 Tax=Daphnia magna TaxID=35525 RepID=UPI001E1BADDF|nr:uncharacterized protein LOC116919933 [Daphnia magna]
MLKLNLFLFVVLVSTNSSHACDETSDEQFATVRQDSDDYWASAYGYTPNTFDSRYYQQNPFVPSEPVVPYQGRSRLNLPKFKIEPFKGYIRNYNADYENQAEGRFALGGLKTSLINTGLFNNRFTPANTFRPFQGLGTRSPVVLNPEFENPISTFDGCISPNGESGICAPGNICSLFGGRPSGACVLGKVCCINVITACGGTVTLNNTFWQSPATISAPTTCSLSIKLDAKFVEQKRPICQLRLDFISFTTAQPVAGTCVDTFQVGGSTNRVPVICGDNNGQHIYIDVPSSATKATDVQLMFNFAAGTGTIPRSWNIKIAMLPCGASYLAPKDCLQYFMSSTGVVRSFNWRDTPGPATRQLNNQNYNICFRTEEIDKQLSNQVCFSTCTVTNGGDAFSITTRPPAAPPVNPLAPTAAELAAAAAAALLSAVGATNVAGTQAICLNDFLLIAGGVNPATGLAADRFCGNQLNPTPNGAATSVTVCTRIRPFMLSYRTDGTEAAIAANVPLAIIAAAADAPDNVGFCLDFQHRTN